MPLAATKRSHPSRSFLRRPDRAYVPVFIGSNRRFRLTAPAVSFATLTNNVGTAIEVWASIYGRESSVRARNLETIVETAA